MKTDTQLKADVTDELAWDPAINAAGIGVMVKEGVVTLTGHLDSFAEKHAAERAVRRVAGVRAIALELDVKLAPEHRRSDSEIAQAAATSLRLNSLVPGGKVQVEVENGWVTLTGEVDWGYQLASAEQCIRPLAGVRGLYNRITIKPRVSGKDIGSDEQRIAAGRADEATVSCPPATFVSDTTTFAPARAKTSAAARPMPDDAPVTMTTFDASMGTSLNSCGAHCR